ncbi:hypothetical protein [Hymenobacter negativus]|uniref:DUF4199 domain-containing protein n=1 Tax=Hymenobacter negativus TaxID=2795026 RepID=A0ABS3QHJ2_9BACT|nr:hypothetical protein [Hymenobacter negativus]MBO2010699.1 hypothetical protein [Hymenobacter negativus]
MSLYYKPSNKMPIGGVLLFLLVGVLASALLALVYIYAIWYIPFVYINVFICLGFGLVLGGVLMLLARAGKLRSPVGVGLLALLVGLVAVYLEWSVYLTLLFNAEATGTGRDADTSTSFSAALFADVFTHPGTMWEAIGKINETGTWSLKGATPSGVFLGIIWVIELLIILGGAYLLARSQADEPFSEVANEWADEETLPHPIGFAQDVAQTRTALETGQFHALTPYVAQSETDPFARLKLHRAPNDHNCQYLTLENVTTKIDDKGKATQSTDTVVQYLAISPVAYEELKKRFGTLPVATQESYPSV